MANQFTISTTRNPIVREAFIYGFAGAIYGLLQNTELSAHYDRISKKYLDNNNNLSNDKKRDLLELNPYDLVSSYQFN
jgi:hypothetical protein